MNHGLHELPTPWLHTELPGPRAKALIEADHRYTSPSYTRFYPLAVARGQGAVIEDLDGNRFLDFTAGIAVCATGHCHPRVVRAVHDQAQQLLHMSGTDFYYAPQQQLAEKLAHLVPGERPKKVFFTNSGTEAVEAAIKLARYHTRRTQFIAFYGGFHGRTLGALSLTASKVVQRRGFAPLLPGVTHVGYGNCYRCPYHLAYPSCDLACARHLEDEIFRRTVPPDDVAAIVVEPIQGEGGYIVPPPEFLPMLREIATRHGILLVADEVQSGMGRTGKMFACEHFGVQPDIVCLAKGIASGLPLGAIVAPADVMNWPPGAHANTFGANPLACVAALETIALLQEELMANAARQGELLITLLRQARRQLPRIGDVRGLGLMVGVDLVQDQATRTPDTRLRDRVIQAAFRKGLLLLGCGESAIRLCPPLVISEQQVRTAVDILLTVLQAED